MFFHVDESGNTGNNLFDVAQPTLSYGLLSSRSNVDVLGVEIHSAMLASLGVDALHAAELGLSKILCTRVPGRRLSIYPETP